MKLNRIKWKYEVEGQIFSEEKEWVEKMEYILSKEYMKDISVEITIEGGNQFHILKNNETVTGYMKADQCYCVLKYIMAERNM